MRACRVRAQVLGEVAPRWPRLAAIKEAGGFFGLAGDGAAFVDTASECPGRCVQAKEARPNHSLQRVQPH